MDYWNVIPGSLALGFLVLLYVGVQLAFLAGAILMFPGRCDTKSRCWLTGISALSISTCIVGFRPMLPGIVAYQLVALCHAVGWLCIVRTFQLELGQAVRTSRYWLFMVIFIAWQGCTYLAGWEQPWGVAANALVAIVMGSVAAGLLFSLQQRSRSKSLVMLQLAMFCYVLSQSIRLLAILYSGDFSLLKISKLTAMTQLVALGYAFGFILLCTGYWGYSLEKLIHEKNDALAGQRDAEGEADLQKHLVAERDRLLIVCSRLSAIRNLSALGGMLIHDLAQPIQMMSLNVMRLRSLLRQKAGIEELQAHAAQLEEASDKATEMIGALRSLLDKSDHRPESVSLAGLISRVASILGSEARSRNIELVTQQWIVPETEVRASEVMLQRILLNVVSNAFEVLSAQPMVQPAVLMTCQQQRRDGAYGVLIRIVDNGPGFPQAFLEQTMIPWESTKEGSLGLGLMLANSIVQSWGGQMRLLNGIAARNEGAVVEIWLTLATDLSQNSEVETPQMGNVLSVQGSYDFPSRS